MSVRTTTVTYTHEEPVSVQDLQHLQKMTASLAAAPVAGTVETNATPTFESLTPVEQAAGSLGVHPDEWRPIAFINNAHFDALVKNNALDDTLLRRIEAYRKVAASNA